MKLLIQSVLVLLAATLLQSVALADKLDECPDPEAARRWVKACMQENPYNTKEACEERALRELCGKE